MFVKFTTEKGVSAKVRNSMKAQVMNLLGKKIEGLEANKDGGFSLYLADDATNGDPIYAHISVVVSQRTPEEQTSKTKTKTKKKSTEDEPMPNLFEGEDN